MNLSEIYSAMNLKIKLNYEDSEAEFTEGALIQIKPTQEKRYFLINQYGKNVINNQPVLCKTGEKTADYLIDLFDGEQNNIFRCMFLIDVIEKNCLIVQSYIFQSITEYKTGINIIVSDQILERTSIKKLENDFIWNQLGVPAIFCLNYKNDKKKRDYIRFVGGKRCLIARSTEIGIFADKMSYLKEKDNLLVDVYVAPEIKFVLQDDSIEYNKEILEDLEKISDSATYIARWEAYEELSKKMLEEKSNEFGGIDYVSYSSWPEATGISFEFVVTNETFFDESLIGKELGASEKESERDTVLEHHQSNKQIGIGEVKKISEKKITTFLETEEYSVDIPKKGVLKLYFAGDNVIMARRFAARKRMIHHESPIKTIVALIEKGVSKNDLNSWRKENAVTDKLRKNLKSANTLNREQIEALELAINTPDIALIQGPPGTGKTTVIKAICERFREVFEKEEKNKQKVDPDYVLQSPKILISSFQNEAVDNAISAPLPGDIPAFRKTSKRIKDSSKIQYQRALENWYTSLYSTISNLIEDSTASEFIENKRKLDDAFLSYKNAGEPISLASELINNYLKFAEIPYPKDVVSTAKAIILAETSSDDDYQDPIVKRIESQRTDIESFKDDGVRNVRRLAAYIRINEDLDISEDAKLIIESMCENAFTEEDFIKYVKVIEELRNKYCKVKFHTNLKDKNAINKCILALSNAFSNHYINTLSSIESKKSLILSEFRERITQDYEAIVKKYSMTTAATCQTSLDIHSKEEEIFDLVIVDEAARANPLDLFIPMSMGKKIILVGDHKQLPHMLEPEILKKLEKNPKFQNIPELEKSLFERLFEMFSSGRKRKAIPLTQQFRMHPAICSFVSASFYDGILKTAESISPEMRSSPKEINNGMPLTYVDIPILKGAETKGISKTRWVEVEAIGNDVRKILSIDPQATIGLITFYLAQEQLLRRHLCSLLNDEEMRNVEIGTVDAFQGKEFDYVLLSCVRSNSPKNGLSPIVGFLNKPNRLCVAFSRAKRQLVVYGDAATLDQIPCFNRLHEICAVEGGGYYREY